MGRPQDVDVEGETGDGGDGDDRLEALCGVKAAQQFPNGAILPGRPEEAEGDHDIPCAISGHRDLTYAGTAWPGPWRNCIS